MEKVRLVEGESGVYEVKLGEEVIGGVTMREDTEDEYGEELEENFYLLERLDVDEEHRGKGYGAQALGLLKKIYGCYYVVPDSVGATRLYDREGRQISDKDYSSWGHALDQGFGVFEIY